MKNMELPSEKAFVASQYGKEKEYWLDKLSGHLVKTIFPYDYTHKGKATPLPAGEVKIIFPGQLSSKLINLGTGKDHRIHIILLSVMVLLLQKYTGSSDIIVGVPIYKQEKQGRFINTMLAIRHQLPPPADLTCKDLLMQTRHVLLEAVEHQNYPLDTLVYQLDLPVYENEFSLFDIILLLENIHDKKYIPRLNCNTIFSFWRTGETLEGKLEYNRLRYKNSTAERIVHHFIRLVEAALAGINKPLNQLEIITPEEKQQLVYEFNDTDINFPHEKTLHQLFAGQVEQTPDHVALAGPSRIKYRTYMTYMTYISYDELNQKSDQLAWILKDKGVKFDTIVGIMAERSVEMAIGLLSILKAGGAYLPLDPDYPAERIKYMLKDSNAGVLLTTAKLQVKVKAEVEDNFIQPRQLPIQFINIEMELALASEPLTSTCQVSPANLAYVIYTSGSTGRPKAVGITHRNVVNTLYWRKEAYQMNFGDVALQLFPFCFDGFVTSFFTPLLSGALVVMPGENEARDIVILKRIILQYRVTHFISVPLLYRGIIENLEPVEASSLKVITLAGDKITFDLVELTRQKNQTLEIVNEYGVTEAAVMSTLYRRQEKTGEIFIGKPIGNTKIYIMDPYGGLQAIGIFGELCLSGAGVSAGYLNNPELTFERFQRIYMSHQSHMSYISYKSYIYKTGDLARWMPDGNIQLAGRIDHQVKIRGNRIEPGEIQNRLLKHTHIKEAIVVVTKDNHQSSLCVYFAANREMMVSELREYLSETLPEYMVPSYFICLEKLPCTSTGKIDYKSLPDPKTAINTGKTYQAPANETEAAILRIWADILGLSPGKISTADDFFDLGGNSISILKVQARLIKQFQQEISISTLFLCPTIKELAGSITRDPPGNETGNIVKLNKGKNKKNIFMFHPLHGMVYPYKELAKLLEDRFNVYGVQARGLTREVPLPETFDDMLRDYLPRIKAVQKTGPYIFSGFCIGNVLAYEAAREMEDEGEPVEKVIMLDTAVFIPEKAVLFYRLRIILAEVIHFTRRFFKKQGKCKPSAPHPHPREQSPAPGDQKEQELKQRVEANNKVVSMKYKYKRIIRSALVHIRTRENPGIWSSKEYWQKMSKGKVECFECPGNHDTILAHPDVKKLAEIIKTYV